MCLCHLISLSLLAYFSESVVFILFLSYTRPLPPSSISFFDSLLSNICITLFLSFSLSI